MFSNRMAVIDVIVIEEGKLVLKFSNNSSIILSLKNKDIEAGPEIASLDGPNRELWV